MRNYAQIIRDPMDLQTISKRLSTGKIYVTKEIFIAEVSRIFNNCRVFNGDDTVYYACADRLEEHFVQLLRQHFPRA